ncbi:MAG: hypothetical protein ACRD1V_02100, partial [Vicinamibacterales bacterium]
PWIVSNPIYVMTTARKAAPPPSPPPVASEALNAGSWSNWRTERAPGSIVALTPWSGPIAGDDSSLRIDFTLAGGAPRGQYIAAVRDVPADVASFTRLAFRARANHPLRISVQVRDTSGQRWVRSAYVGRDLRDVAVDFADMRATSVTATPAAPLGRLRTILFVVDLTNALPSASGSVWLSDLRLER